MKAVNLGESVIILLVEDNRSDQGLTRRALMAPNPEPLPFVPESFPPSIPRPMTWCRVPGASNLGCLGIINLHPISPHRPSQFRNNVPRTHEKESRRIP